MVRESRTEAFVCDGIRTPFGRYGGALSAVRADDLAALPLRALQERNPAVDWSCLDDVCLGCANQAGEDNRNVARMAVLLAGLPHTVPASTVNRLCGSSLDATLTAARSIQTGACELVIAGGVESMSRAPFVMGKAEGPFARGARLEDTTLGWRFINPRLEERYGCDSMAQTAENLVAECGISRADQDAFALRSQQRYARARERGFFVQEIIPNTRKVPGKPDVTLAADEHPRADTTLEALARLKGVVRPDGSVTAGNSSGINDGAGALLLASEAAASRHGLTPRARILGGAVAGVAPRVMGRGPVPATQRLLARTGMSLSQLDVIELNEAFAAQALAVLRELGLPDDAGNVNPNGGAIAVGHPLGASGARLVMTAVNQLQASGGRFALCTMCIGVGQGIALLLERV
ncbi:MAG TPA: 3-oxoadipyl-CoA thiolase [Steroidobacteraceae bacterium]|nr:3-oxoadipyl-CoA thiolase [Steroidobacteraceae bacterium]